MGKGQVSPDLGEQKKTYQQQRNGRLDEIRRGSITATLTSYPGHKRSPHNMGLDEDG
jgi:hypothetical protein